MARQIPYEDTTVPVKKTVAEIEDILQAHEAEGIAKQFEAGRIKGMGFKVNGIPYQLPAEVQPVFQYLLNKKLASPMYNIQYKARHDDAYRRMIFEQAERCAWRNLMGWVKAMLAMVEMGMVKIDQVFMPYMLVGPNETAYDRMLRGGLPALMAPREE